MTNTTPPTGDADDLERPSDGRHAAVAPIVDRVAGWIVDTVGYYGVGRLTMWAGAAIVVVAVGWWMMRPPPPPTEALLPVATATSAGGTQVGAAASTTSAPTVDRAAPLVVHVAGAVVSSGVYDLPPGARVRDAIDAAGGATGRADLERVNLAAPLVDGARVHIAAIGESAPPPVDPGLVEVPTVAADEEGAPIEVNRAGATELERLPGVGPSIAAAIVEERESGGPFGTVDDLQRVPGIGPARVEAIRDLVVV